jgi:deazaflavin-dependent oxidoreductase (nitroreductase family)
LAGIGLIADEQFCYLTTVGRRTGKEHTIEIWFGAEPGSHTIYMLAGGGRDADWVKNIGANPLVQVMISNMTFSGVGRVVKQTEEERLARRLVVSKYYHRNEVRSRGWEAEALPVAVDFEPDRG